MDREPRATVTPAERSMAGWLVSERVDVGKETATREGVLRGQRLKGWALGSGHWHDWALGTGPGSAGPGRGLAAHRAADSEWRLPSFTHLVHFSGRPAISANASGQTAVPRPPWNLPSLCFISAAPARLSRVFDQVGPDYASIKRGHLPPTIPPDSPLLAAWRAPPLRLPPSPPPSPPPPPGRCFGPVTVAAQHRAGHLDLHSNGDQSDGGRGLGTRTVVLYWDLAALCFRTSVVGPDSACGHYIWPSWSNADLLSLRADRCGRRPVSVSQIDQPQLLHGGLV